MKKKIDVEKDYKKKFNIWKPLISIGVLSLFLTITIKICPRINIRITEMFENVARLSIQTLTNLMVLFGMFIIFLLQKNLYKNREDRINNNNQYNFQNVNEYKKFNYISNITLSFFNKSKKEENNYIKDKNKISFYRNKTRNIFLILITLSLLFYCFFPLYFLECNIIESFLDDIKLNYSIFTILFSFYAFVKVFKFILLTIND